MTSPSGAEKSRWAPDVIVPAVLVVFALLLRLYQIDVHGLWFDDAHSVHMARLPFGQLLVEIAEDIHPPLYFVVLGWWMQLAGSGEFALRYFSVVSGLPTVPLLFVLGRRIGGARLGTAAALVAAVSPLLVYYAQEVRMYAGSVSLVTAMAYFGWRAIELESPRRWFVPYVALATAAGFTHLFNLVAVGVLNLAYFALGASALIGAGRGRRGLYLLGWWLGAQLAVAIALSPWLPVLGRKELVGTDEVWRPLEDLMPALGSLGQALAIGVFPVPGTYAWLAWGVWLPAAAGALAAFVLLSRRRPLPGWLWAAVVGALWLTVCFALVYFSLAGRREVAARYVLVSFPGFALLVASGLAMAQRWQRVYVAVLVALVVLFAFPLADYYQDVILPRPDDRGAVRWFESVARAGDAAVYNTHYQAMAYEYYATRGLPVAQIPAAEYANRRASEPGVRAAIENQLAEATARHNRLWVFYWQDYYTDPDRIVETWLDNNLVRFRQNVFNGWIRVKGYEKRSPAEVTVGGVIRLTGYEITPEPFQPGQPAMVKLEWLVVGKPAKDYQVFVHVVDKDYQFAAQHDGRPVGGTSLTSSWLPGMRITDIHDVTVAPGAATGEYSVLVGFYSLDDMQRLRTGSGDHLLVARWPLQTKSR